MAEFAKMSPEEYRELKQNERNEVFEMLSESTQSLMEKEELLSYLDLQAELFDQTTSNVLLIKAQKPKATWVRTSDEWNKDGVYVSKGEKAINVLTSHPYRRDDGNMGTAFEVAKVFDISQTGAKDRPMQKHKYHDVQASILHRFPCTLEVTPAVPGGLNAFYDRHQEVIFVKEGMSADETFNALTRELACYELMRMDYKKTREDVLPYAECASYLLAKRYGIVPAEPDCEAIAKSFEGKKEKDVRKDLSDAKQAAAIIHVKVMEHQKSAREARDSER